MPGITRLRPGYSRVGVVDFHKDDRWKINQDRSIALDVKSCLMSIRC